MSGYWLVLWLIVDLYHLRITSLAEDKDTIIGIQLVHAGRMVSLAPVESPFRKVIGSSSEDILGLEDKNIEPRTDCISSTNNPYLPTFVVPSAMNKRTIATVVASYASAAERAARAGFKMIEIEAGMISVSNV